MMKGASLSVVKGAEQTDRKLHTNALKLEGAVVVMNKLHFE